MWLLPSLNRLVSLRECLISMRSVGVLTPGKIILGSRQRNDISQVDWIPAGWSIECQCQDDKSLIDVMNRFVRDHPDLQWYGYLQDDLKFVTPKWDVKLIAAAGNMGIASCNDLWRAPKRNTGACAFGGDLMRAWGFWGPPKLQHCYIDDFWEESGRECKNWKVLMDVITPHRHFANPKNQAVKDSTYHFSYGPIEQDKAEWLRFKSSAEWPALLQRTFNSINGIPA